MSTTTQLDALQTQPWWPRLHMPAYSVVEAARYAGTSRDTVTRWQLQEGESGPLLPGRERRRGVSYLQLIELALVSAFRRYGVSLQRIRKARALCSALFGEPYPFATLRFRTDGLHLLLNLEDIEVGTQQDAVIVADVNGQLAWGSLLGDRFAGFDYEYGIALRWHLAGRDSPVVLDPRFSFGAPAVRGIATWAIRGRWLAREPISAIMSNFDLTEEEVRAALAFEGMTDAA